MITLLREASAVTITDGMARRIASEWHSGQASPLYSLASTGFVDEDVIEAARRELDNVVTKVIEMDPRSVYSMEDVRELRALLAYVERIEDRPMVSGWSDLWDERRATDPKRSDFTVPTRAEELAEEGGW